MNKRFSRRLLLFCIGTAVVAMAVGVFAQWPRTAITPANAAKIRQGMTREQVEAMLGGPARNEATAFVTFTGTCAEERLQMIRRYNACLVAYRELEPAKWLSNEALVVVHFDSSGCVTASICLPVSLAEPPPSLIDVLRGLLQRVKE